LFGILPKRGKVSASGYDNAANFRKDRPMRQPQLDALTPELWQRLAQSFIRRRAANPGSSFVKVANEAFTDVPETNGVRITHVREAELLVYQIGEFDKLLIESHANVPRLAEALAEARKELSRRPTRELLLQTIEHAELRSLATRFLSELPPAEIAQRLSDEQLAGAVPLSRLVGLAASRLTQELIDRQETLPFHITGTPTNGHTHLTGRPLAEQITATKGTHKRIVFVGVRPRQEAKIKEALVDMCSVVFVDVVNGRPPVIPTCDFCIILVAQVSPTIAKQIAAGQSATKSVLVNSGGQSGLISKARQLLMSPVAAK
jgi:hypothetical protein